MQNLAGDTSPTGLAAIKSALSEVLRDLLPNVVCSARLKDPKHPELLP
jgi:hypothetical protein